MAERICARCGEALDDDDDELCWGCVEDRDEERFVRDWHAGREHYLDARLEKIASAAADVCTSKEIEVLNALLANGFDPGRAAASMGRSRATVVRYYESAEAKIQAHEAVANAELPTRRETTPRTPPHLR